MRIEDDIKLDFKDVLIKPKRSTLGSRQDVDLIRDFKFKWSTNVWSGTPIISSNMDTTGTFEMHKALAKYKMLTCIHKYYTIEQWKSNINTLDIDYLIPSIGIKKEDLEKFDEIYKIINNIKFLAIDIANGYSESLHKHVSKIRDKYPNIILIAGNVVTPEMCEQLILSGADIVKVGIGNGFGCSTTEVTGIGYPQLSSVIEGSDAAHGLGGHIISDGGCRKGSDISKAFGAGADFVMLGSMFAGHDESGGEIISEWHKSSLIVKDIDGSNIGCLDIEKKFKKFYGMSSKLANEKYNNGLKDYRASEGKEVLVPYKGPVDCTIKEILGSLRSAMTYVGSKRLKEFSKRCTFIKIISIK
jgi:GMP reductase